MSPQEMKKEEECVAEMLTGGQIELSDSPWSSPVVLVTKKDAGTRLCVDYRHLNDVTVKDAYPLPRIDDTLDMLAGKQWFSTLDLASGYWQVSLSREAMRKMVFATHSSLFQFRVPCVPGQYHLSSFDGALANLTLIFERIRTYGLLLKSTKITKCQMVTKCHLFRSSVPFLGHIVGCRGLACDPVKIEDVKSWPVPDCLKSVR